MENSILANFSSKLLRATETFLLNIEKGLIPLACFRISPKDYLSGFSLRSILMDDLFNPKTTVYFKSDLLVGNLESHPTANNRVI